MNRLSIGLSVYSLSTGSLLVIYRSIGCLQVCMYIEVQVIYRLSVSYLKVYGLSKGCRQFSIGLQFIYRQSVSYLQVYRLFVGLSVCRLSIGCQLIIYRSMGYLQVVCWLSIGLLVSKGCLQVYRLSIGLLVIYWSIGYLQVNYRYIGYQNRCNLISAG